MYLHSAAHNDSCIWVDPSKEFLYRKTMKIAKLGRKVLEANAWHHRSDALSSVVVPVSCSAADGYQYPDGFGALLPSYDTEAGVWLGGEHGRSVEKYAENEELISEIENVVASVALESKWNWGVIASAPKAWSWDVAVDMSIIVDRRLTASGVNAASRLSRTIETKVKDVKEVWCT